MIKAKAKVKNIKPRGKETKRYIAPEKPNAFGRIDDNNNKKE